MYLLHPSLSPDNSECLLYRRQEWRRLHICIPRAWTGIWMTHPLHSSSLSCRHLSVAISLDPDADLILRFLMWPMDVFKLQSRGGGKARPLTPFTPISESMFAAAMSLVTSIWLFLSIPLTHWPFLAFVCVLNCASISPGVVWKPQCNHFWPHQVQGYIPMYSTWELLPRPLPLRIYAADSEGTSFARQAARPGLL